MQRVVEPEWLDELPVHEPRAVRSRNDLRRLNRIMDHAGILARRLRSIGVPRRIVDLGCGDGSFALRLALLVDWRDCEVVLVDRQPVISQEVHDGFAARMCRVTIIEHDVLRAWDIEPGADLVFTNLFLHHFREADLTRLLENIAAGCRCFAACEPHRGRFALLASRLVAVIGCNEVTRHDAPASVRAGFRGGELSRMWPKTAGWILEEQAAGPFSHLFVATQLSS